MSEYRLGVDIGGTFTDFTVVDRLGQILLWKEDSTPAQPEVAIARGVDAVAGQLGISAAELLARTRLFVHGTTIATNAIIQRNGPRVGLLCTEGFRDILYFRDGFKPERFNIHLPHPPDFVERHLRIGIPERVGPRGDVLTPLDEQAVVSAARKFAAEGVESVAVTFLWSIVNPAHEQRAAEIVREEMPGIDVLCSSDVLPEIREWERTSATVLGAYILPGISAYLRRLEQLLEGRGFQRKPLIMQINGGCASVGEIIRRPVYALASGPAAAPAAAAFHGRALELDDLIVVDMGGTSFDVCLVRGGRASMSRTIHVDGNPIGVAGVEVHSVGAGGGSVAWVDSGGALRVGPRSAGATPGPACYALGGEEPTVTDANVVLGYLSPTAFLGGRRTLDEELARAAVGRVAASLGLGELEAAAGLIRVVNGSMVNAIRAVSIERGIDPRSFAMVVGGGAGGLHASRLARELGIGRIVVPREAGTFCAFGMTVTDVRHDHTRALHSSSADVDLVALSSMFAEIEREATERLASEGFGDDEIVVERLVDARYPGQVHELTVSVGTASTLTSEDIEETARAFHELHRVHYTYSRPELPVEFLHWRVNAVGRLPLAHEPDDEVSGSASAEDALTGERMAYFPEAGGLVPTRIYEAASLRPGAELDGPAVIESATTTVVVNPGDHLRVQSARSYVIDVG